MQIEKYEKAEKFVCFVIHPDTLSSINRKLSFILSRIRSYMQSTSITWWAVEAKAKSQKLANAKITIFKNVTETKRRMRNVIELSISVDNDMWDEKYFMNKMFVDNVSEKSYD